MFVDALAAANQALTIRTSTDAQNAQAYALFKLGMYNESIAAYVNLTATITNHAGCILQPCLFVCPERKHGCRAQSVLAIVTNLDPNNADTWNQIGLVYMSQDDSAASLDAFNYATQITATNASRSGTTRARHSQRWDATRMHWVVLTRQLHQSRVY